MAKAMGIRKEVRALGMKEVRGVRLDLSKRHHMKFVFHRKKGRGEEAGPLRSHNSR